MMRQPVSRITFDRRRGFLGVHLQEGAPFVDASWNEGADIAWSLLRDAIIASGLEGTAGRELRIAPITDHDGRLRNLTVCGTSPDPSVPPRPFYCDGLPVLWLADLPIDAQPIGDAFRADATSDTHTPSHGTWIDLLQPVPYQIVLRARIAVFDRLDDRYLDDPGLDTPRGTFRKRVVGEVRVRKVGAAQPAASNVRLSVDGSYRSELNALYRVELDDATGTAPTAPAASILWDPDAAATVARVVDTAAAGDRKVHLDTTDGFDAGFVRFEGPGIGPELYRVLKAPGAETSAIQVTRHRCDRAERSLAAWQVDGQRTDFPPDHFAATFLFPAPVQAGDVLRDLPAALNISNGQQPCDATVVAVVSFDGARNAVKLTLRRAAPGDRAARALSITGWQADGPAVPATDGSFTAVLVAPPSIADGDLVLALPAALGNPGTGPWIAEKVAFQGPKVSVAFGPAGLAQDLRLLDTDRTSTLRAEARQGDTTLVVDDRADWTVGMRVTITGQPPPPGATGAPTLTTAEERAIVRIEHFAAGLAPSDHRRFSTHAKAVMVVRLDQPLSNDHAFDSEDVIPERVIRARRFAGHTCRLPIERVNPARDGAASIANFSSGQPLAEGLSLHLTIESSEPEPQIVRGDGWHFAARGDGWFETRLFAPVEEAAASEVPLAQLTVTGDHHELIDLRPLPAALAVDDELARITAAASTLTDLLGDDPAAPLARVVARLAGTPRVQSTLLPRLGDLARVQSSRLAAGAAPRSWLDRLYHAVTEVEVPESPPRRQLATIAFALGGLAFAFAAEPPPAPSAPAKPSP